jgi:hypothetical protein
VLFRSTSPISYRQGKRKLSNSKTIPVNFWVIGQEQSSGLDADFENPGKQVETYLATVGKAGKAGKGGKKAAYIRNRTCWQFVAV